MGKISQEAEIRTPISVKSFGTTKLLDIDFLEDSTIVSIIDFQTNQNLKFESVIKKLKL